MICGYPPFYHENRDLLFEYIKNVKFSYPNDISPEVIDFLDLILVKNKDKRLGRNGAAEIKKHKFFEFIDWDDIFNKRIKPPFVPRLNGNEDTKYICEVYIT